MVPSWDEIDFELSGLITLSSTGDCFRYPTSKDGLDGQTDVGAENLVNY